MPIPTGLVFVRSGSEAGTLSGNTLVKGLWDMAVVVFDNAGHSAYAMFALWVA